MTLREINVMTRASGSNIVLLLISALLLSACSPDTEQQPTGARNVILFIGDGFGATRMSLLFKHPVWPDYR